MQKRIEQLGFVLLAACGILAQGCAGPVSGSEAMSQEMETTQIRLNGNQVVIEGDGARWEEPVVAITAGGIYEIRGASDHVSFFIESREAEPVHLVLNEAEITSTAVSAIVCEEAAALVIASAPETNNVIQDMGSGMPAVESQEDRNALVYSEAALAFQGSGSLELAASYHAGVQAPQLTFSSGTVGITANRTGILAERSMVLEGADLSVYSQGTGVAVAGETGTIRLNGGSLELTALLDGLYAENAVYITGGVHQITAGAASGGVVDWDQSLSQRGIAAGNLLQITGGSLQVDSQDHCLYSRGDVLLEGGALELQAENGETVFPSGAEER